ncbi:MAG: histidine--tRNA ligase [Clostridia bacterium]|nr:histidine--tRNA ligase [Clostridia bacterium]
MGQKIQRPKGTADVTVRESHLWHFVEGTVRDAARRYGFREIRFPAFEHTELVLRGIGDTTDVVQKEMYTFEDKGGRSITLRPEGTASAVRAYIENGENQLGTPYKAYYIAPMFRYEQPQSLRLREHHQFGVECFGSPDAHADAEVIALGKHMMDRLGIKTELRINSIGCPKCRPKYYEALLAYLEKHRGGLCKTCLERMERNPMRVLDCKEDGCKKIAADAPRSIDYLCEECKTHFGVLRSTLDGMGIGYEIDSRIVRGLDYYTRSVFEFVSTDIGAQGTVLGGGRYDGLIEQLGGGSMPAVGFGCGLERLIAVAQACGFEFPPAPVPDIFLAGADEPGQALASRLTQELRGLGAAAEADVCGRGLKAQLKHADRTGARFSAVIGQSELDAGTLLLKDMRSGEQTPCAITADEIIKHIEGNGK